MSCLLLHGLLAGYVDVPSTKVMGSVLLEKVRPSPWNGTPSLIRVRLLRMGRLLLSMLVLRLWSVDVIWVVGNIQGWRVGPLLRRSRRWSVLI